MQVSLNAEPTQVASLRVVWMLSS